MQHVNQSCEVLKGGTKYLSFMVGFLWQLICVVRELLFFCLFTEMGLSSHETGLLQSPYICIYYSAVMDILVKGWWYQRHMLTLWIKELIPCSQRRQLSPEWDLRDIGMVTPVPVYLVYLLVKITRYNIRPVVN